MMGISKEDIEFICVSDCFIYGGIIAGYGLGVSSILLVSLGVVTVVFGPLLVIYIFYRRFRVILHRGDINEKD